MKKKYFILYLILSVVTNLSYSQGWEWRVPAAYNEMLTDQAHRVYAWNRDSGPLSLEKFDTDGSSLWSKTISGSPVITAVKLSPLDHIVILGNFTSTCYIDGDSIVPKGPAGFFILELSASGAIINKQVFGSVSACAGHALNFAVNGDWYLGGGFMDSLDINGTMIYGDSLQSPFFVRMNAAGTVLWAETASLYTHSGDGYIHDIAETASGNLYVGFSMSSGLLDYKGYQFTASSGQYLCYLGPGRTILSATFTTYFGMNFFLPLELRTKGEMAFMKNVYSHHGCSGEMNRWDATGAYVQGSWPGSGIGYDIYNGKVYAILFSYNDCNVPTAKWRSFMELSDNLVPLNQLTDSMPVSSYGIYNGLGMIDTNTFYVLGTDTDFGAGFLGKYNRNLASSVTELSVAGLSAYPNPAAESITIAGIGSVNSLVKIYNPLGLLVFSGTAPDGLIDISHLSPAVYYLEVTDETKTRRLSFIKQ